MSGWEGSAEIRRGQNGSGVVGMDRYRGIGRGREGSAEIGRDREWSKGIGSGREGLGGIGRDRRDREEPEGIGSCRDRGIGRDREESGGVRRDREWSGGIGRDREWSGGVERGGGGDANYMCIHVCNLMKCVGVISGYLHLRQMDTCKSYM